jgi:hypothetical protein
MAASTIDASHTDSQRAEGSSSIATVLPLPLHSVSGHLHVRRGPGRPRKARPAPDADALAYEEMAGQALEEHVGADAVVAAAELRQGAAELFDGIIVAVARETASLAWELRHSRDQRDVERMRSRRVDALVSLARLVQERHRAERDRLDVPQHLQMRLHEMFVAEIEAVTKEVLGVESAAELMVRYRELVDESRASASG